MLTRIVIMTYFCHMTKSTLKWIIVLMSVALMGLVAFQWHWISKAIAISEERFKQDVQEALNVVSDKLEQQEILFTAAKKLEFAQEGHMVIGMDSIRFIRTSINNDTSSKVIVKEEELRQWYFHPDSLFLEKDDFSQNIDSREKPNKKDAGFLSDESVMVEIKRVRANIDSVQDDQNKIKKVQEKSHMITIVLNELLSKERKIINRIDPDQLDTLLAQVLKDRGIDIPHEYGVIDGLNNEVVLTNVSDHIETLKSSEFRTRLFTRDIITYPNYLAVYFPDQQTYLFGKVWVSLASSIFLLMVIIGCFGYAIYIIIRQKKLSKIKSDFINNMTHEFKTPISTVGLACEVLQDEEINKNERFQKRYLSIIQTENNRLARQVEKVLQMATLEKKDFKLNMEELDVHEVIDKALRTIMIQIEKKEGKVTNNLNASQSRIISDEVHLTNIIYNLLDNANKYSKEKPEINISTDNKGDGIIISISDHGIGMTREEVNKIFERFYRVPTGNLHDVKGFGLGLTYVKTMVGALGGNIVVKSTPMKGSKFEIYLPKNGKNKSIDR